MRPEERSIHPQGKPDIAWAESHIPNLKKYAEQIRERDASTQESRDKYLPKETQ